MGANIPSSSATPLVDSQMGTPNSTYGWINSFVSLLETPCIFDKYNQTEMQSRYFASQSPKSRFSDAPNPYKVASTFVGIHSSQ